MKKIVNVIAEIANAHQGDPDLAIKLAEAAANSGATSIKFQIYFADELLTKDHPRFLHFKNQSFSVKTWNKLLPLTKKFGKEVYADVFGIKALKIAIKNKLDGVKIHSSDLINTKLLDEIAFFKGKVFLSVGGSSLIEIKYAIERVNRWSIPSEIILMHGFQAYPTKIMDSKLKRLQVLKELFPSLILTGYMDHVDADSVFSSILPLLSIPYGINYLEKHITFNRSKKGVDYYSSFEPHEFAQFIDLVNLAVDSIGEKPLAFSASEKKYRDTVKKSWVLNHSKKLGDLILSKDLTMKRSFESSSPPFLEEIINQPLLQNLDEEDLVNKDSVNQKVLAIIVARTESSRLPGKAMAKLAGEPAIGHLLKRVLRAKEQGIIETIAFCTTKEMSDDILAKYVANFPVKIYRGEVENVLSRMMLAVNDSPSHKVVLRITGDDILIDLKYLEKTINQHLKTNANYTDAKDLPSGTEVEVFDALTLQLISELSIDLDGTEYLTNYIVDNVDQFKTSSLKVPNKHKLDYRLTIDTQEDFELVSAMLDNFKHIGKHYTYSIDDIVNFIESNPDIAKLNKGVTQKQKPIKIDAGLYWDNYTDTPLVTVYITNHNYEKFLKQSIDSVLAQHFSSFELIIIDDGSSDGSREIIEEFKRHSKVKIIYQENKGLNISNNIAINLARGKYVMRLDADDYLHESALLLMSNKLESDLNLAMVFPDYYMVGKDGSVISHEYRHDFSNDVTLFDQPAHGACTMVRKDVLIEVGGYSEEFSCQDGYELWVKIIGYYKVSNISLPLFYYRQHGENLTSNEKKILSTRCKIIQKHSQLKINKKLNNLCIVPIRADNSEKTPLALRPFANSTLLDIVINQIKQTENNTRIVITTNNQSVIKYLKNVYQENELIVDSRPEELTQMNTKIDDTIEYILNKYRRKINQFNPDAISIVNYEYPLRDSVYIDNMLNSIYLYEAISSISVIPRSGNLYQHNGHTLADLSSNTNLRLERNAVYEERGGLHSTRYQDFINTLKIKSKKITHIVLDKNAGMRVDDELDFQVAEFLFNENISKNNAP